MAKKTKKTKKKKTKSTRAKTVGRSKVVMPGLGITLQIPEEMQISRSIEDVTRQLGAEIGSTQGPAASMQADVVPAGAEKIAKMLAAVATNAWRAKKRMIDPDTGEPYEHSRLLSRNIDGIESSLSEGGVQVIDHTDNIYDSGMAIRVLSFEPTAGITREIVKETVKPEVRWSGQRIQMSEVVVGCPNEIEEENKEGVKNDKSND